MACIKSHTYIWTRRLFTPVYKDDPLKEKKSAENIEWNAVDENPFEEETTSSIKYASWSSDSDQRGIGALKLL